MGDLRRWTILDASDATQILALALAAIDDHDARLVLRDALLETQWSAHVTYHLALADACAVSDYNLWQSLKWGLALPDVAWARAVAAVLMFVPTAPVPHVGNGQGGGT